MRLRSLRGPAGVLAVVGLALGAREVNNHLPERLVATTATRAILLGIANRDFPANFFEGRPELDPNGIHPLTVDGQNADGSKGRFRGIEINY